MRHEADRSMVHTTSIVLFVVSSHKSKRFMFSNNFCTLVDFILFYFFLSGPLLLNFEEIARELTKYYPCKFFKS